MFYKVQGPQLKRLAKTGARRFVLPLCLAAGITMALWNSPTARAQTTTTSPASPVRIYLGNDDHTDYMWTADADTYNTVFVQMLDYYLDLADKTAKNPSPYQSRCNADGSYWLWQYERQKTPTEFNRLIARIKDGHISAPLNMLVSCYGAQPTEAVLRGMYYAGRLERRYDLRFPLAIAMENQTLPLGLSSLWAGSGAKYSWKGICGCVTQIPKEELGKRDHEIYWYAGPDNQRVLMKWHSLGPGGQGTYTEAGGPYGVINFLDSDTGFLGRYTNAKTGTPYAVRAAFGFGGDCLDRKTGVPANPGVPKEPGVQQGIIGYPYTDHFFDIARKQSSKTRQVITSNTVDFFDDFAKNYAGDLPSESVTYGNEWDLYSASMAETSARVRRSVEKLRSAELLATLVSLEKPAFLQGREKARDLAFTDLGLYWEHDWTADGPVSRARRAAWQEVLASEIENYVNPLYADSASRLGYLIQKPEKTNRFYVCNPLGQTRADFADFAYSGSATIHVRDVTENKTVPHQMVVQKGVRFLRIWASGVPSAGYKTYEIVDGASSDAPADEAATVRDNTIENAAVRLTVDGDGAITSFIDKTHGNKEIIGPNKKLNDLTHNETSGVVTVENHGPVSVTLKCESRAGLAHTTWITLYRNEGRVDIRNEITENFGTVQYWNFGFNIAEPSVHTEELGVVLSDKRKSQGGDYAERNARYDHVTLNHFADISDGTNQSGVTLSNADCSFAKLGNSTARILDASTPQINVLAGGQVDGRYLGIQNQNGATHFLQRFALRAHGPYDAASAMRFALEHQNPLVTGAVVGTNESPYPETNYSLLGISDPDVLLWSVKPAEEGIGSGIIVRAWNLATAPRAYSVQLTGGIREAKQATHIETDLKKLPLENGQLKTTMGRTQIQTLRLIPSHRAIAK